MTDLTDLQLANAIIGFFLPALIAAINQRGWSAHTKSTVAFLACLLSAFVVCAVAGNLSAGTWVHSALIVVFSAQGSYLALWRPSGITNRIEDTELVDLPGGKERD